MSEIAYIITRVRHAHLRKAHPRVSEIGEEDYLPRAGMPRERGALDGEP